tara:strand:+ start:72 stop:401 length:330 start_codon:yes stop_codon:yes gene_type:complete
MKICCECGGNILPTKNYNESGESIYIEYCLNENCITHSNGYEKPFNELEQNLKAINPTTFCRAIGKEKAIKQNSQTRTKKRHIERLVKAQTIFNLLGYEVRPKPKKPAK